MSSNQPLTIFTPTTELHDLGATRFDHDTAAPSDRDTALTRPHYQVPLIAPAGRAPRGLETQVHAWTTFQFTTEDVDKVAELKGDLHGGQLHRVNRAARGEVAGVGGIGMGMGMGMGGGVVKKGTVTAEDNALCGGRKPAEAAPPLAKGMAEEMNKGMFWDEPIV
jgi:hypothetical protein